MMNTEVFGDAETKMSVCVFFQHATKGLVILSCIVIELCRLKNVSLVGDSLPYSGVGFTARTVDWFCYLRLNIGAL